MKQCICSCWLSGHLAFHKENYWLFYIIIVSLPPPPVIRTFHGRKLNYRINNIHKRTLKILHKDYISSFDDLLVKDNSFRIHHTNLQKIGCRNFKIENVVPEVMKNIFRTVGNPYSLRNETKFKYCKVLTVRYGIETASFAEPTIWNSIPSEVENRLRMRNSIFLRQKTRKRCKNRKLLENFAKTENSLKTLQKQKTTLENFAKTENCLKTLQKQKTPWKLCKNRKLLENFVKTENYPWKLCKNRKLLENFAKTENSLKTLLKQKTTLENFARTENYPWKLCKNRKLPLKTLQKLRSAHRLSVNYKLLFVLLYYSFDICFFWFYI